MRTTANARETDGPAGFLHARTRQVNGISTHYADAGQGEPVLLLHGFPETLQSWRETLPALSRKFRVLAPDLVGAGRTDKPAIAYSPQEIAAFLRDFLDALDVPRAHLVGTDTGLAVALAFARLFPGRVARMVLSAGTVHLEDMRSWEVRLMCLPLIGDTAVYSPLLAPVLRRAIRRAFVRRSAGSREAEDDCLRAIFSPGGRRAAIRLMRSLHRERAFLAECVRVVRIPTLVVYADRDCFFPLSAGLRLAAELGGASLRIIPDCGHFLHEEKPEEYSRVLEEFLLAGQTPNRSPAAGRGKSGVAL